MAALKQSMCHCWGSVEKQPLCTTPKNFKEHQKGIAFTDLPRTFQDLVNIARSIGIKYIWIDSLCIIQGNSRDWHSEAEKMGDVYRNAAFVIAASGAEDSSQGLFINDRLAEKVFRLPYRTAAEVKGTFNIAQSPNESDWHPAHGPLETRAWALQERYLARRLITFMPRGITWRCDSISVNEAGESFLDFRRNKSWALLLSEYTRRALTFPSDRTEAIRGVAEEIQRSRTERYIPDYGVWDDQLTNQLLWFKDGPFFDNGRLSHKPSWSWITTGSAKIWPQEVYFVNSDGTASDMPPSPWTLVGSAKIWPQKVLTARPVFLEIMSNEFVITSEGNLQVSGHLSTIRPAPSCVRDRYTARDLQVPEVQFLYDRWSEQPASSYILAQDIGDDYDQSNLGTARFDNDAIKSYSHAWFLGKQPFDGGSSVNRKPFVKREFIVRVPRLTTSYED
ncbi:unnamed protein product [Alternaria alternata]